MLIVCLVDKEAWSFQIMNTIVTNSKESVV